MNTQRDRCAPVPRGPRMSTDLTLVVTAHDETAVCGPTMRSADLAVEAARARGLQRPGHHRAGRRDRGDHGVLPAVALRPLGAAGPAGARPRQGPQRAGPGVRRSLRRVPRRRRPVQRELAGGGRRCPGRGGGARRTAIAHPELNVVFDGSRAVLLNIDQTRRCSRRTTSTFGTTTTRCAWRRARRTWRCPTSPGTCQRPVLPGLPVHHREPGRRVASCRGEGHDHLQAASGLLPGDREQPPQVDRALPAGDGHRPDPRLGPVTR